MICLCLLLGSILWENEWKDSSQNFWLKNCSNVCGVESMSERGSGFSFKQPSSNQDAPEMEGLD